MRSKKILFPLILLFCTVLCGCGEEVEEVASEVISVAINEDGSALNPLAISKNELLAMTAEEVKDMVETYLPNYRSYYKIPDDMVMTENDWLDLRDLICLELYGSLIPDGWEEKKEIEESAEELGIDVEDPNWIYETPTADYIEPMTTAEFAEYMNGLYAYSAGDATEELPDFSLLEDSTLKQLKTDFVEKLKKIEQ